MAAGYQTGGVLQFIQKSAQNNDDEVNTKSKLEDLFSRKFEVLDEEISDYEEDILQNQNDDTPAKKIKKDRTTNGVAGSVEKQKKKKKKKPSEEDMERLSRTLFVGNVATSVTRKILKKLFMKYGSIETVRIRSVPVADPKTPKKVALITKNFHSEREAMNAYIVFKEKTSAEKALEQQGYVLEGHRLRLDSCSVKKQHDHQRCVFVGNLPFNITDDDLFDHFSTCGQIDDVRVIRDKESGIGKGFAYVKFQSKDHVIFGLKLNGSQLNGRTLRVTRSKEQKNKSKQTKNTSSKDANRKAFERRTGKKSTEPAVSGLKSTRKKDREIGKKLFAQPKQKSRNHGYKGQSGQRKKHNKKKSRHGNDKKKKT